MIHFGFNPGFNWGFPGVQASAPASSGNQQPQHSAPQASAPAREGHIVSPPVMFMAPAFMMAYPQMGIASPQMGVPSASGTDVSAAPASGSHVTANPTNAMASQMGGQMAGMMGTGLMGPGMPAMGGAFAMPMMMPMMMAPVFVAFGFPVFQGSQSQPALAQEPVSPDLASPTPPQIPEPATSVPKPPNEPVVKTEGAKVDVVPSELPMLRIQEMAVEDFRNYRFVEKAKQQETTLDLSLTTQDGDRITLNFTQLDAIDASFFRGRSSEGNLVKDETYREEMDRVVNMDVVGQLSDGEQAAIDAVLSTIIDVVRSFFAGEMGAAVDKLKAMDFDGAELSELSLNLSMTRSVEVERGYHGHGRVHQLQALDGDLGRALDFMATEQKRLVEMAKDVLDAPSAAKLVRSLMPPLMNEPFAELAKKVADATGDGNVGQTDEQLDD
jgi:hypothetical protein